MSKLICPKCGTQHQLDGERLMKFCTACGYRFPDTPEERFAKEVKAELEESATVTPTVKALLQHEAEAKKIPQEQAQAIVDKVLAQCQGVGNKIALQWWSRTFECKTVCPLKLRVRNLGRHPIASLEARLEIEERFAQIEQTAPPVRELAANTASEALYVTFTPHQSGELPARLILTVRYGEGRPEVYFCDPLFFTVAKPLEGDVHIRVGDIKMVNRASQAGDAGRGGQNIKLDFGDLGAHLRPDQQEQWRDIPLQYDKTASDQLYEEEAPPKIRPAGHGQRALHLKWKSRQGVEREVWVVAKSQIRFGRGLLPRSDVDLPLFVDPVWPIPREVIEHGPKAIARELHEQPTMRISGHHLLLRFRGTHFEVIDTSSNGSVLENQKLQSDIPAQLHDEHHLQLANVCRMRVRIFEDTTRTRGTALTEEMVRQFEASQEMDARLIGDDCPGPFTALRLRRTWGRTNETYVLLVKYIDIGTNRENGIYLPEPGVTLCHARLFTRGGCFGIKRMDADGRLVVAEQELATDEEWVFAPGTFHMVVGTVEMEVEIR